MALTDAFSAMRMPAINSRFSFDDLLESWHDALVACLPGSLRSFLSRRDQRLLVVPGGTTASVYRAQGGERQIVGELDPQMSGSFQAVLAAAKGGGRRRRSVVQLAPDNVLRRSVAFPAQVQDNLHQVLGYEIDRLSPFQADEVYFDFRVGEGSAQEDKVTVELALCRRDQVRDWLQGLRDAGMPADSLTWDGAWPKANLLPPEERPQRGSGLFSLTKLLLLLVLLLGTAALATPIWQMQQVRDERAGGLEDLKVRSEKVHEMRKALELARKGSVAVLQAKWEQPRMIDLLQDLTERLPDNTWVQNLDFRDGEVQVRGESAQATALIDLLEQSPGITEVSFRSPVVQVAGSGRERFHISLTYKRAEEP
jgi:general secretion pathway protein L